MNESEASVPAGLRQAIDVPPFGELADPRVLAGLAAAAEERGWDGFVIVDIPPGHDPVPWARAGATWTVTDFGMQPTEVQVREVIDAGPP